MAFRQSLRRIDEVGINRIMSHGKDGFIIISANRSEIASVNPNCDLSADYEYYCRSNNIDIENVKEADAWLSRRNKKCDKELADALKSSPYAFSAVFGGYKGEDAVDNFEPSYIVYNHVKGGGKGDHIDFEKLKEFGIELAKRFKQESVYVQGPDEAPMYVDQNGEQINSGSSKNFKFNRDEEELFTTKGPWRKDSQPTFGLKANIRIEKRGHLTILTALKEEKRVKYFLMTEISKKVIIADTKPAAMSLAKSNINVWDLYNRLTYFASHNESWPENDIRSAILMEEGVKFLMRTRDIKEYVDVFSELD